MSTKVQKNKKSSKFLFANTLLLLFILAAVVISVATLCDQKLDFGFVAGGMYFDVGYWQNTADLSSVITETASPLGIVAFTFSGLGLIAAITGLIINKHQLKAQKYLLISFVLGIIFIVALNIMGGLTYLPTSGTNDPILDILKFEGGFDPSTSMNLPFTTTGYVVLSLSCLACVAQAGTSIFASAKLAQK